MVVLLTFDNLIVGWVEMHRVFFMTSGSGGGGGKVMVFLFLLWGGGGGGGGVKSYGKWCLTFERIGYFGI
jgi:hypothetical protein